jgi:hypothetical protein
VDGFVAATTTCRPSTGQCDVAESCTGSSGACPADGFQPSPTSCVGTSNGGACDGTDSCDGAGTCVDGFKPSTTTCRPSAGQCDAAESCTGSSGACPADAFKPNGTPCNDGNACTTDTCQAGACSSSTQDTVAPVINIPANQVVIASNGHENHFHTGRDDGEDHYGRDDDDDDKDGDGNHCDGEDDDRTCGSVVVYKKVTATDNCDPHVKVVCTPRSGSNMGLGVHTVTCTATDASGNQSSGSFTVTVLSPLHVVIQSPLADDNIDNNAPKPFGQDPRSTTERVNAFKVGDKLLHKVKLYDCTGSDVTTSLGSSVSVRLDVSLRKGSYYTGAVVSQLVVSSSGVGGVGNLMMLSGGTYQYNLMTTGYEGDTDNDGAGGAKDLDFFQSLVSVEYNAVPGVDVGRENLILESK